jgi:hypothetical protein
MNNIDTFVMTKSFINAYYQDGKVELLDRNEFELYVDQKEWRRVSYSDGEVESCGDDSYEQTFEKYYRTERVLIHLQKFIIYKIARMRKIKADTDRFLAPLTQILSEWKTS